jgi:large subunit ribosomal protein L1
MVDKKNEEIKEEVATETNAVESTNVEVIAPVATTKAGKHSAKAVREAEQLAEKEARKEAQLDEEPAPRPKLKPRVKTYSKKQKAARELVDKEKLYTIGDAVDLLPKLSSSNFDATAELHVALGIDPRQADQQFRNSVVLPAGTGSEVRIAVLTDAKLAKAAADAGADMTDSEQLLADIAKGKFDFDVLVASPDQMAVLGRHAKALGPKGLMPSPKSGTVTPDPAKAVAEIKKGRLDLKNDASGIVHVAIGKVSFKSADLLANAEAVLNAVVHNRPSGVKGVYVKSAYMAATMTPSIKLDISSLSK